MKTSHVSILSSIVVLLLTSEQTVAGKRSYFCSQNLVHQFDKKLLEEFPSSPGLCTATCIANLTTLLGSPLKSNAIKNVVEVIHLLKKVSRKTNPYNPNKEGTTFLQMLQALSALEKAGNTAIQKIVAKSHEELAPEDQAIIKKELKNVTLSKSKIKPTDLKNSEGYWMLLGLVSWLGPGQYSEDEHDVLALWDQQKDELTIIDPAFPNEPSRWVLLRGTKDYPTRLRRVSGPYYQGYSVVVVHDWVKVLTQK